MVSEQQNGEIEIWLDQKIFIEEENSLWKTDTLKVPIGQSLFVIEPIIQKQYEALKFRGSYWLYLLRY
jgi:hypothetical protein